MGLSQVTLSRELGLSPANLSEILRGRNSPNSETTLHILDLLESKSMTRSSSLMADVGTQAKRRTPDPNATLPADPPLDLLNGEVKNLADAREMIAGLRAQLGKGAPTASPPAVPATPPSQKPPAAPPRAPAAAAAPLPAPTAPPPAARPAKNGLSLIPTDLLLKQLHDCEPSEHVKRELLETELKSRYVISDSASRAAAQPGSKHDIPTAPKARAEYFAEIPDAALFEMLAKEKDSGVMNVIYGEIKRRGLR